MRIQHIVTSETEFGRVVQVAFTQDGYPGTVAADAPVDWDTIDQMAWASDLATTYLSNRDIVPPGALTFPDLSIIDTAKDDFEALPGWASWTAAEAAAWIDANVVDLATSKVVMANMARAIIHLRNIVIER